MVTTGSPTYVSVPVGRESLSSSRALTTPTRWPAGLFSATSNVTGEATGGSLLSPIVIVKSFSVSPPSASVALIFSE